MNISSIIVRANGERMSDEQWETMIGAIGAVEFASVAMNDKASGTIIAVIEAPNTKADIESLKKINAIKGVLSADMHLTYDDDEFSESKLQSIDDVAEMIDTKSIDEMRYNGDVNEFLD